MSVYGYVRVSSSDQNEVRQMVEMKKAGVLDCNIFIDKQSGKDFNRPQYHKLTSMLMGNDLLYILSIGRLGRNYEEIQTQWRFLTKEVGVDVCDRYAFIGHQKRKRPDGNVYCGLSSSDLIIMILSLSFPIWQRAR